MVRIYGKPAWIAFDNGTAFTCMTLLKWANDNKVAWPCIDPARLQQNGDIESLNGSQRVECRNDSTNVRPHSSQGTKTPVKARRALEQVDGTTLGALVTPENDQ